ncbi:MAG: hypothetical protein ACE5KE_09210, partial [Methanosarcinales archaeon]
DVNSESDFDNTFTKDYGNSGLVALWHMDEGSGTIITDSSGNENDGILKNGTTFVGYDGGQWNNRSE